MYRTQNNQIRNFVLTFVAGWIFGQVFNITPKALPPIPSANQTQRR